jgi:formylglycine-generating enzyme required for sulfatase activity
MKYLLLLALLLAGPQLSAQSKSMRPVGGDAPAGTERRLALVVGNKDYTHQRSLTNPLNDADDMAAALRKLGFEVTLVRNADYKGLMAALGRFRDGLFSTDVAFFYYSGHGSSYGGKNYLLPTDVNASCLEEIEVQGVALDRVLSDLTYRKVKTSLVVLDACRDLPGLKPCTGSTKEVAGNPGLVRPTNNPRGSMVVYATEEGSKADDNPGQRNGLFTAALLRHLTTPNWGIRQILDKTSAEVESRSGGNQSPGRYDKLQGDFVFVQTTSGPISAREEPTKPEPARPNPQRDLPVGPELVFIPGGSFDMGSTEGEEDEKPVHTVTVSGISMAKYETTVREFAQFVAETSYKTDAEKGGTSRLWNPATNKYYDSTGIAWRHGADGRLLPASEYGHPVVHVSHNDAVAYCGWLSKKVGRVYRLPTEAEWEYAGGNGVEHTKYSWGIGEPTEKVGNVADKTFKARFDGKLNYTVFANYTDGYGYTSPVGQFKANKFGLFDMTGNVSEWCGDWYGATYYASSSSTNPVGPATGSYRVLRGGSWYYIPQYSRVAARYGNAPSYRGNDVGFRVVAPQ